MQYNTTLAITDARRGSSREKLYKETCLESFSKNDGIGNCYFFKIFNRLSPEYHLRMLPSVSKAYKN